jgi:hypothetical protein
VARAAADRGALATVVRGLRGKLDQALVVAAGAAPGNEARERLERGATALLFRTLTARFLDESGLARPNELDALRDEHPWLFVAEAETLPVPLRRALVELATTERLRDPVQLGWAYQFWKDPTRAQIDARIGARGKVSARELADKTQLFTELYMVEWLLQNSLAPVVRGLAQRPPHTAPTATLGAIVDGWPFVLDEGTVDAVDVPPRLRDLRLLDPACGTGHFLLGAFDLLATLYEAEAADRGEPLDRAAIARQILTANLWGSDIDNQAVELAATLLSLKARAYAQADAPGRFVARGLVGLSPPAAFDEPLSQLSEEAQKTVREWCVAGSLIDPATWSPALRAELDALPGGVPVAPPPAAPLSARLVELLTDGRYDVVCGNPPYLATAKIDLPEATINRLFGEMPDLSAAFFVRGLRLCKRTGRLGYVTPSNWMTLTTFRPLRARLREARIAALADLGKGAFRHASKLIQTAMVVVAPTAGSAGPAPAPRGICVAAPDGQEETSLGRLVTLLKDKSRSFPFDPQVGQLVAGAPLLLGPGWNESFLATYRDSPKIGDVAEGRPGIATSDNHRFLRAIWEIPPREVFATLRGDRRRFAPYVKGADGALFFEPFRWVLSVADDATALRLTVPRSKIDPSARGLGVAYTTIGHRFGARLHTVESVRDVAGASFFPSPPTTAAELLCALNRTVVKELAHALNPTINFQIGDVRRLPFLPPADSERIVAVLRASFDEWARAQETSHTYDGPGPQRFRATARWAQTCIDAPAGSLLPAPPGPTDDLPPSSNEVLSHAVGVLLGRFAPAAREAGRSWSSPTAGGWLDPPDTEVADDSASTLPFLFVGPDEETFDGLRAPQALDFLTRFRGLAAHDRALTTPRQWLRDTFFPHHEALHEGRPVYFPLSSAKRSFVVFVWFHRLTAGSLERIVSAALRPAEAALVARPPSKQRDEWLSELQSFRRVIETIEGQGPANERVRRGRAVSAPSPTTPPVGPGLAPFCPFPEDGTRVVAATLWPLLYPFWRAPAATWQQLENPTGKRHLDWSRTAAHYFPERVRRRLEKDKSLAYAHRTLLGAPGGKSSPR